MSLNLIIICFLILIIFGLLILLYFIITRTATRIVAYENLLSNILEDLYEVFSKLDKLDSSGTFKSDDEIGFFFDAFSKIISKLKKYEADDNTVRK